MYGFFEVIKNYSKYQGNNVAIASEEDCINFVELYNLILFAREYLKFIEERNVILREDNQFNFSINFLSLILCDRIVIPVRNDISNEEIEQIVKDTNSIVFEDNILNEFRKHQIDRTINNDIELINAGIIQMTSGSTGSSKYCIRTIKSLIFEAINFQKLYSLTSVDQILSLCPLHHSFALGAGLLASIYSGSCLRTISTFSPRKAMIQIATNSITYLVMVPDMARMLCLTQKESDNNEYHIRIPLVGAGLVTEELFYEFKNKFKSEIKCNYGSTETGAIMSGSSSTPISSVGMALSSVRVKLKDENGIEILSEVAQGELYVKSDAMLIGYLNRDLNLDEDGYYFMGDIARRDENGNYFIVGRQKPIIKIAGVTVNLTKVENVIKQYPGIKDCILYVNQVKESKEVLMAMLAGVDIDEIALRKFCISKLPSACIPSKFYISESIDKNELGKVKVRV